MINDIYIRVNDPGSSIFYPGDQNKSHGQAIADAIIKDSSTHHLEEFSVDFGGDGVFRCRLLKTVDGDIIVARRHNRLPPDIYQLGMPFNVVRFLTAQELCTGGLIVIVGTPGSGKTTTCASMTISRLATHGGVCITIEDPPEYAIQGTYGQGVCWQIQDVNEDNYHLAMKGALRGYPSGVPSILMMGEVRDSAAAASILNASIDGRLVLMTMHAGDTRSALGRLRSMATEALGAGQADYLIAESLRGVIHQRLDKGKIDVDLLVATEQAKAIIRSGKYEHLGSEVERQRTLLSLNQHIT